MNFVLGVRFWFLGLSCVSIDYLPLLMRRLNLHKCIIYYVIILYKLKYNNILVHTINDQYAGNNNCNIFETVSDPYKQINTPL